jgi:hypothetical protein
MKQGFRTITQVSLAVLLALTLGLVTAVPSIAQESPEQSTGIDPEVAKYDLDAPEDFVSTETTGGTIKRITDDKGDLNKGWDKHYIVLVNTLLILPDYLKNLKDDGDKLELAIEFEGGAFASFTIEAFETIPTANPAAYDLLDPAHVEITINWHTFHEVLSIVDDDGNLLERGPGRHYSVLDDTLTIFKSYLGDKLTTEGDKLVLTIEFDGGAIDFTIKAVGRAPSIDPERADYDLDNPANATTTITWGTAKNVTSIKDDDHYTLIKETDYTLGDTIKGEATLTILNDYLSEKLKDYDYIDQSVELSIEFGFNSTIYGDLEHYATFSITAIGTYPTISPVVAPYDLRSDAAVNTTITWRHAKSVTSIVDDGNYTLIRDTDYTLGDTIEGEATLTILNSYLAGNLTPPAGDSLALTIEFDFGQAAHFAITAVNEDPRIDPERADYDLDKRGDVATNITRQVPIQVVSITENGNPLIREDDYEVEDIAEKETATLTILSDSYLNRRLRDIDDKVVLTIEFSVGDPVMFNITPVRCPRIDPDDDEPYNWDDPPDFLEANITWGSASNITGITEGEDDLPLGLGNEYIVLGSTLLILNEYLRDKLSDLEPVTLTIDFSDGTSADLIITVIGNHPTISPSFAPYARHAPHDVTTTITWGSATNVESIVDDEGELVGNNYSVTPIDDKTDTLTIFHAYLEDGFKDSQTTSVKLTVDFDVGSNRTFVITTGGCFIATAAYGTPMAEQIQTLREFRDEYLLTNTIGQAFVGLYYKISPPIAEFITEHPTLKPVVRAGLVPAVAISTAAVNTSPAEKTAILGLLVLISVALAVWTTKRRGRGPQYSRG